MCLSNLNGNTCWWILLILLILFLSGNGAGNCESNKPNNCGC
jgi:hypothetical protein